MLFDWRNDEETRRTSLTTAPLKWEEHRTWLRKMVSGECKGRSLYVVELGKGEPIGTVRSEEREDGLTEVSYTVAPSWRGKGLGTEMVVQFAREQLQGKKLVAQIKKGANPASEKIARALGLAPYREIPAKEDGQPPTTEWR
jgi:RimJ/RimL family protein N-acetyltransferase